MEEGSIAVRRHVDLTRIGLGVSNELGNRLGWNRWVDHHEKGRTDDASNRRDVAEKNEIEVVVERRVDRRRRVDHEKYVPVRRRLHDCLGGDVGASARPVLGDEWLAEALRKLLADQARDNVGSAAWGVANNKAHRPRRIGLRWRNPRACRKSSSARGQLQKLATGKFHGDDPSSAFSRKYSTSQTRQQTAAVQPPQWLMPGLGQTRPFCDIGIMSGLPES